MPSRSSFITTFFALLVLSLAGQGFTEQAAAAEPPRIIGVELGLGGQYKLGCWTPLRVQVEGGTEPLGVSVVAVAPDSDAIGVATTTPGGRPLSTEPGRTSESLLYTRIGKDNAPIELRLMLGNKIVDQQLVQVDDYGEFSDERLAIATATPATHFLVAAITDSSSLAGAIVSTEEEDEDGYYDSTLGVAKIASLTTLPRDAIGYDGFDVVLLNAGRSGWLKGLTADDPRLVALEQWVRDGGRLVFSCGTAGAELLIPGGALATFLPGQFAGLESLPRTEAIERYAKTIEAETPIDLDGGVLQISRLENVTGQIEAYDGRVAADFPLVVRSPLGFGEVTFVAFDLDAPALAGWSGLSPLMARLLDLPGKVDDAQITPYYGTSDTGFVGALINRLDNTFTGVRTTPFLAVVGLVIGYLLLIGPGDYFLVKRIIGRMEATWITFPLLVLLTSAAAYAAAYWLKGSELRVNQIEVIDIDSTGYDSTGNLVTSPLRGTLITHLFSPQADRYNLSLAARSPNGEALANTNETIAWLGKSGYGLGGMQTASPTRLGWRPDYVLDPTPQVSPEGAIPVRGLPVQVWSTKTLLSRWTSTTDRTIEAQLTPTGDGLAEGRLTNDTGAKLTDCRLLYGDWAWRLGTLDDGETTTVDESISPLRLRTLLRGTIKKGETYDDYRHRHLSIEQLLPLLSINSGTAEETNDQQWQRTNLLHCNLSHHLAAGRAILLARCEDKNHSELLRDGKSLSEEHPEMSKNWIFCRYILEVGSGQ